MNRLFQDKNIFILGVGSDIGARLAAMFAAQGAKVTCTFRSESSVKELRPHREIQLIPCDAADPESVTEAAAALRSILSPGKTPCASTRWGNCGCCTRCTPTAAPKA